MWQPSPDALVTDLGHELVLLHAKSGQMYTLNATGRAVWQALPSNSAALTELLRGLGASEAEADMQAVLDELRRAELVHLQCEDS